MTEAQATAWTQLFSVGLLWVSLHCVGMCGPLLTGLDVGGLSRGTTVGGGALRVLLYQLGKSVTYATFGAAAGLMGATTKLVPKWGGGVLALALGIALLVVALARRDGAELVALRPRRSRFRRALDELMLAVRALAFDRRPSRVFFLGALLGFLPCMIPMWALSLSALSSSAMHGALLMVGLVVLTTPVLLGVTLVPRMLAIRLGGFSLWGPRVLLAVSGVWMVLVGLAGMKIIGHAHVGWMMGGRHYMIMFW